MLVEQISKNQNGFFVSRLKLNQEMFCFCVEVTRT